MIISSTEVQNNFGKFLKLAEEEDIIITKNGRKVARLVKYFEGDDYIIREGSSAHSHEGMKVSYEEFLKISRESENRYEYIDGQIYLLASPKVTHQKMLMGLCSRFHSWFQDKDCLPLISPLDITLYKKDEANIVQPDLVVICGEENITEGSKYLGVPTLVVEVLSESTRSRDVVKKKDLYMAGGVSEYWIVNPFSEEVNIYLFENNELEKSKTFKEKEQASSFVFEGLKIDTEQLFNQHS